MSIGCPKCYRDREEIARLFPKVGNAEDFQPGSLPEGKERGHEASGPSNQTTRGGAEQAPGIAF